MFTVQLASDLHLEFDRGPSALVLLDDDVNRDVLVLAGDVDLGTKADKFILKMLEFSDVVYVLGYHEGYRNEYLGMLAAWKGPTTKRVNKEAQEAGFKGRLYFLENDEVVLQGVRFLGCTLWSDFSKGNPVVMNEARWGMNDYLLTSLNEAPDNDSLDLPKMQPEHTLLFHNASVKFLEKKLAEDFDGPTVVVTHHAPSNLSVPEMFKNDSLNGAYFTNLEYLMLPSEDRKAPELWLHGHTHNSFSYTVGETDVVCNPRGYFPNQLNGDFDNSLTLEV